MVPSSGYVRVFDLTAYDENGVVLMMPDVQNPDQPCRVPRYAEADAHTFSESARWQEILNCQNAADLNEMILKPPAFANLSASTKRFRSAESRKSPKNSSKAARA